MSLRQFIMLALLVWNIMVFLTYAWDKYRAVRQEWRVPEKTLLLTALSFGGFGAALAAHLCHHKTRKWYFHLAWWVGGGLHFLLAYLLFR